MTWCGVPGASSRACRGILALALRLESWGMRSELFLSVNNIPIMIDLSGDGAEGCTLEEKDQPEGTSCELHEWDLTRERRR